MDISGFRRSENIEDYRDQQISPLMRLYIASNLDPVNESIKNAIRRMLAPPAPDPIVLNEPQQPTIPQPRQQIINLLNQ